MLLSSRTLNSDELIFINCFLVYFLKVQFFFLITKFTLFEV